MGANVTEQTKARQAADTRWDPGQYLKFAGERERPAGELLQRVPLSAPALVFDLGCGTGNATLLMAARWPQATVYGLDNSKEMLEKAQAESSSVRWVEADIRTWTPAQSPDLIYSNAALHWVEEHAVIFPRLAGFLRSGGCLAVQMPLSWDAPSHRLMRETLDELGRRRGALLGTADLRESMNRRPVLATQTYYDLLSPRAQTIDIWETEYLQVLTGDDPVLEWVRGTGLRPILNGLADDERALFLAEYRQRLRAAYPARPDGATLYPFRRLFIVALMR